MKQKYYGYILCSILLVVGMVQPVLAQEYTYLNPPTISVMDFDVSILSSNNKENNENDYFGKLVNHALINALVKKNGSDHFVVKDSGNNDSIYYPPLLKIYDKKFVEVALSNNKYSEEALYDKNSDAFKFASLDFVVLGNVFRQAGDIGLHIRVLNTNRAEELYSYSETVDNNLSDLNSTCDKIAGNIIKDILKAHCAQLRVFIDFNNPPGHRLFCQPRLERDTKNEIVSSNDTHKREITDNTYYWLLPGEYVITVYNKTSQSIQTLPFTVTEREIKQVSLKEEHFSVEKGSITVKGIDPSKAYRFYLQEHEKSAGYHWEIGKELESKQNNFQFYFTNGNFIRLRGSGYSYSYNPLDRSVIIDDLIISTYDMFITEYSVQGRERTTGILRIASRQIVDSDVLEVKLQDEPQVTIPIEEFRLREKKEIETYRKTRITFYINNAFSYQNQLELSINDGLGRRTFPIEDNYVEKLIIEDEYNRAEWNSMNRIVFELRIPNESDRSSQTISVYKTDLDPAMDKIVIVDFEPTLTKAPESIEEELRIQTAPDEETEETEEAETSEETETESASVAQTTESQGEKVAEAETAEEKKEIVSSPKALTQLNALFPANLNLARLKSVTVPNNVLDSVGRGDRKNIYNNLEKTDSFGMFLLNVLPGGLGSFIQGNTGMGVYKLLSDVALIGGALADIDVDGPLFAILAVNEAVALIASLISPFVYQSQFNNQLAEKLRL